MAKEFTKLESFYIGGLIYGTMLGIWYLVGHRNKKIFNDQTTKEVIQKLGVALNESYKKLTREDKRFVIKAACMLSKQIDKKDELRVYDNIFGTDMMSDYLVFSTDGQDDSQQVENK